VCSDGGLDSRLAGLDRSFGAYFDAQAAEALMRSGRHAEAAAVLDQRFVLELDAFNAGRVRFVLIAALLAARRGDADVARSHLDEAVRLPVDEYHQLFVDAHAAEVHLALGDWSRAAIAAERGWEATDGSMPLWALRFAWLSVCAAVQQALDDRAAALADHGPEHLTMLVGVGEDVPAEAEHAILDRAAAGECLALTRPERGAQVLEAAGQQIVLVVEVRVEGGAADVGAVDDLLHGQRLEPLLPDERHQRSTQELFGPFDPPITRCRHVASL
jgi:hypothetical protein